MASAVVDAAVRIMTIRRMLSVGKREVTPAEKHRSIRENVSDGQTIRRVNEKMIICGHVKRGSGIISPLSSYSINFITSSFRIGGGAPLRGIKVL